MLHITQMLTTGKGRGIIILFHHSISHLVLQITHTIQYEWKFVTFFWTKMFTFRTVCLLSFNVGRTKDWWSTKDGGQSCGVKIHFILVIETFTTRLGISLSVSLKPDSFGLKQSVTLLFLLTIGC